MKADGTDQHVAFDAAKAGLDPLLNKKGIAGAFQPSWSPDGEWIVFSVLNGDQQGIHRKNPGGVDEVQLTENAARRFELVLPGAE